MNFDCTTNSGCIYISLLYQFLLGLALFVISNFSVKKFISIAYKFQIIDAPNNRSSHTVPTVRGGGVVIALFSELVIVTLYFLQYLNYQIMLALSCAFILAIVGFIDDLFNLPIKFRLPIQLIASLIAVALVVPINFHSITSLGGFIILVFSLAWSTNLFNFMDGTDGLAASEAIFVLAIGGLMVFLLADNSSFGFCLLLISSIIAGFLWFNLPPAKIFMGDVGSVFLGFLIGISAIISHFVFGVSCVFWLIIYSAFCFDATITLIRRFISGEKWYLPHRSHAYQRLQNIGWKHKDILYALFLLNVFLLSVGLIAYYYDMLFIAVELVFILLSIIYLFIELSEKKYEKSL